jgi:hypothetical protein
LAEAPEANPIPHAQFPSQHSAATAGCLTSRYLSSLQHAETVRQKRYVVNAGSSAAASHERLAI